ncbi:MULTISPECIES: CPBP family intramembrane glutamic endopeptidase [Sphingobacterium]|uniref:CPBP family intramembrane glutamic endopeptidase n=1 Tax=Sphingobacterium anhuiense TaxID=493780 RepID=A0ABW5Z149_9SPHI|nr:CPBP family intramembrane glutamic endopeptidase [Sphingobacterium sp. UDSM-2020]QQD15184.1 CPBP family intramembrane metalloprotease [Sphingobacterium sp. UDSM-2020]
MEELVTKINPGKSLFRLLLYMIVLGVSIQLVLMGLSLLVMKILSPESPFSLSFFQENTVALKGMLLISSVTTFILPAWILYRSESGIHPYFERINKVSSLQYLFVFAAMLCFIPMMSLLAYWNESMQLPDSLQGVQQWMRASEDSAAVMTKQIVEESTWGGLLINLIILAVVPAVGEEMVFRGCLQNIFGRWIWNKHVVIWLVAIIFSAFHMQFFGFIPRMLLGAFFGYLYVWSRNIYLPIFGHFINNASATITAFYYTRKGIPFEEMNNFEQEPIWVYLASLIFTVIFVVLYYRSTKKIPYGARLEED